MLRQFLAILAFLFIRCLTYLLRYRFINRHHSLLAVESGRPVLYAFFHGQQLMLFGYPAPKPLIQMVSLSKDGELQAEILRLLGFQIVRGSPGNHGQEALHEMAELVIGGCHAALAVDGSRGPYRKVKRGILELARDTGGLVIPLAAAARHKSELKTSWDRYTIPWPFSRTFVIEGEGLEVPEEADGQEIERLRQILEVRMLELTAEAGVRANRTSKEKEHGEDKRA